MDVPVTNEMEKTLLERRYSDCIVLHLGTPRLRKLSESWSLSFRPVFIDCVLPILQSLYCGQESVLDLCLTLSLVAPPDVDALLDPLMAHVLLCRQRISMLMSVFLEPKEDASAPVGTDTRSSTNTVDLDVPEAYPASNVDNKEGHLCPMDLICEVLQGALSAIASNSDGASASQDI